MDSGILVMILVVSFFTLSIIGIPIYYVLKTKKANKQFRRMEALTEQYTKHLGTCFSHLLLLDTERRYKDYMTEFSKNAGSNGYNSFIDQFETALHNQKILTG
jgi:hypothetical protein